MNKSTDENDIRFMKAAIREAKKGLGCTSPNPVVGAVIVGNEEIIAAGYHHKAGLPHAEREALALLSGKAHGCTLYVTLEPCHHHGKTPPCTAAILDSGITRVVIGMTDPNPEVAGGGADFLQSKGIQVEIGLLENECRLLNEAFLKLVLAKRPFVIAKSAVTLDGWTATSTGHSLWITNEKSRKTVHRLRNQVDAVMVGVGTVIADNPQLTTRSLSGRRRDAKRIILDTNFRTPVDSWVVNHDSSAETVIVVGEHVPGAKLKKYEKKKVSFLVCPVKDNRIDLPALLDILAEQSISSLLLEGGAAVMNSMLKERLVDKYYIFVAPKILGGGDGIPMVGGEGPKKMNQSLALKDIQTRRIDDDIMIAGYPDYNAMD